MIPRGQFSLNFSELVFSWLDILMFKHRKSYEVENFEKQFAKFVGSEDLKIRPCCRIAVLEILTSLGSESGEVLVGSITIPDIINAIIVAGYTPVFYDLDLETHGPCLDDIERKITNKTVAIIVTHLSGIYKRIDCIKRYKKILIIEDCSQVIDENIEKECIGDFIVYSLSVGKNISTYIGGAISNKNGININYKNYERYLPIGYMLKQLMENSKIYIITSILYQLITRHFLKLASILSKKYYLNIHKKNILTKFNERDIFFDDLPVRRSSFPKELYSRMSDFQARLGLRMIKSFNKKKNKRKLLYDVYCEQASSSLKDKAVAGIHNYNRTYTRVPIIIMNREVFQLNVIKKGLDCAGYGLNNCHEEKIFEEFKGSELIKTNIIHKNSLFLDLNEKNKIRTMIESVKIMNEEVESDK